MNCDIFYKVSVCAHVQKALEFLPLEVRGAYEPRDVGARSHRPSFQPQLSFSGLNIYFLDLFSFWLGLILTLWKNFPVRTDACF